MTDFLKRATLSLRTGWIFVFYGEVMFWATPERDGMDFGGLLATWLAYSVMAHVFLCVSSSLHVRSPETVFLAGAFYGWFEEGIVVQTMYGSPDGPFPMSISFTGLAWHALISVYVGWFSVRRVLAENSIRRTLTLGSSIGVFYGLWAIFWWNEPPAPMKELLDSGRVDILLVRFSIYAISTTALLIFAHWIYNRVMPFAFRVSKAERWCLGVVTLLYYACITVPAAPAALWVLPPLLGTTVWALWRRGKHELRPDAISAFAEKVRLTNYLALFSIPTVAIAVYFLALASDARLATNQLVYLVTTPVGALLWIAAVYRCGIKRQPQINPQT